MEKNIDCRVCNARLTVSGQVDKSREVAQLVTCLVCGEPNEVLWPMNCGWSLKTQCPECNGTGKLGVAMFERDGLNVNAGGRVDCTKCSGSGTLSK
jgi:hypothetical protein